VRSVTSLLTSTHFAFSFLTGTSLALAAFMARSLCSRYLPYSYVLSKSLIVLIGQDRISISFGFSTTLTGCSFGLTISSLLGLTTLTAGSFLISICLLDFSLTGVIFGHL